MKIERRIQQFGLKIEERSEGDGVTLRGMPIVFNSLSNDLGGFREIVLPESVTKTLAEDDVRGLFNHDPNQPLGRIGAGTMSLKATKGGVEMRIDLPDTAAGRTVSEGVKRGDITGGSFGFRTIGEEWLEPGAEGRNEDEDGSNVPLRKLTEVRIFDVGPVTYPAYPETEMALRSLDFWNKVIRPFDDRSEDRGPGVDLLRLRHRQQGQQSA